MRAVVHKGEKGSGKHLRPPVMWKPRPAVPHSLLRAPRMLGACGSTPLGGFDLDENFNVQTDTAQASLGQPRVAFSVPVFSDEAAAKRPRLEEDARSASFASTCATL